VERLRVLGERQPCDTRPSIVIVPLAIRSRAAPKLCRTAIDPAIEISSFEALRTPCWLRRLRPTGTAQNREGVGWSCGLRPHRQTPHHDHPAPNGWRV